MTADERRRALLIGSPAFGLEGVEPDVAKMKRELEAWEFQCVECEGAAATRDGILSALGEFLAQTQPGDAVVIYYAGHGGRCVVDGEGTAKEVTWNYLVPVDHHFADRFRGIAELELAAVLHDLAERTRNVTVILDCCHAAGTFRDKEEPPPVRPGDRVREVPKLSVIPRELQEAIDEVERSSRKLHPDGRPDVVRVVATASHSSAFEMVGPPPSGYLTTELCAALAEAREVPLPWDGIIRQVRERIMARRGCDLQRPEVEGPRHRFPFSLQEAPSKGEHATLVFDTSGEPWIRAGRLHGLRDGDAVEVRHDPETVVAEGTIAEVFEDSARVELGLPRRGPAPRSGNTVVVPKPTARKTVRVEPEALGVEGLCSGLETSQRLSLVSSADATFSVTSSNGSLQVSGPPWLQRIPRPATPQGVQAVVEDLDRLARSEILLSALKTPRGLPTGARPLVWTFEVMVTEPGREHPRPLQVGEMLPEGTRIYAEVRHETRAKDTLYVNVLERGISGRVALINQSEPAGVQLDARETRWVARRAKGGAPGVRLRWPEDVPRQERGEQELICVASFRPLDLRSLLEGPSGTSRRSEEGTRDPPSGALGADLYWDVRRTAFGLRGR